MRFYKKSISAVLASALLLSGCGSSSSNDSNSVQTKQGVFIDDVVAGVKYVNANETGTTDINGTFPYKGGKVEFYLGKIKIGEIDSLKSDNKVFIQDVVGVDRTNTSDSKVLKIARFLQSLDSDDSTDAIEISDSDFNKFDENMSIDDISDLDTLLDKKGIKKVSKEEAERHLKNVLKAHKVGENDSTTGSDFDKKFSINKTRVILDSNNSSIFLSFTEDIKKDGLKNTIQIKDKQNKKVPYNLEYSFNSVKLNLLKEIKNSDELNIFVDLSEIKLYEKRIIEKDFNLTLPPGDDLVDGMDITPPSLTFDQNESSYSKTRKSLITGTVKDNVGVDNVKIEINGVSVDASIKDDKYSANIPLNAGQNRYKIIATDTSGNKMSVNNGIIIYLGNKVAAGGSHSGALKNDELYTWGRNNYGQTGLGYKSKLSDNNETSKKHPVSPVKITTPSKFASLSFMQNFSLAIDEKGDVYSWGYDNYGELGRGLEHNSSCTNCRLEIRKIEDLSNIVLVDAGLKHSLAIDKDGKVFAWGRNNYGQLGDGTTESTGKPVQVDFGSDNPTIVQVTAGSDFSLAVDEEGNVWAWGKNNYGQAGQGESFGTDNQSTPIKVKLPSEVKIKSAEAGTGHVLALARDGKVYGWGNNFSSQIGYNGYQHKGKDTAWAGTIYEPKKILDNNASNPVTEVFAGGNSSYIIRKDKKVYPWGQYGDTTSDGKQEYNNLDFPEDKLKAITSVKTVAAGALHISAIKEDGTVFTWRWSMEGSLGGGDSTANIWFYNYPIIPKFPNDSGSGSNSGNGDNNSSVGLGSPGGNATVAYSSKEPFLKILNNIDENEISGVSQGRELFIAQWRPSPDTRKTLDGLGPLFNANACTTCHISDGRVAPYNNDGTLSETFLFRVGNENGDSHPTFGGQLQTQATSGNPETSMSWKENSAGKVEFISSTDVKSGGFSIGGRISPHLVGMGLLDLVSESTILEYEDINDANNDGISGRAHWVMEEGERKIGRFGWKAINSSLRTQNAGAMHQDMGLTTPINPNENCTDNQDICKNQPNGGSPEVSETALQQVVDFMTALSVPDRRISDQTKFDEGAKTFETIGCASCHRPTMTTGVSSKFSNLSNQKIYPYTDLLLHDMGDSLGDGVKEKDASGNEFRTPPLWGIGIVEQKQGARFLHDGRAKSIKEAIELHDGEGKKAKENFSKLSNDEQESLLMFLRGI